MFGVLGDDLGDSTLGSGLGLCMCHLDTTSGCKLSTTGFLCPQVWVCLFWCIYVKAGKSKIYRLYVTIKQAPYLNL